MSDEDLEPGTPASPHHAAADDAAPDEPAFPLEPDPERAPEFEARYRVRPQPFWRRHRVLTGALGLLVVLVLAGGAVLVLHGHGRKHVTAAPGTSASSTAHPTTGAPSTSAHPTVTPTTAAVVTVTPTVAAPKPVKIDGTILTEDGTIWAVKTSGGTSEIVTLTASTTFGTTKKPRTEKDFRVGSKAEIQGFRIGDGITATVVTSAS